MHTQGLVVRDKEGEREREGEREEQRSPLTLNKGCHPYKSTHNYQQCYQCNVVISL